MNNGIQYVVEKRRDPAWDQDEYRASMHALARRKKARKRAMSVLGAVIYERLFGTPPVVAAPRPVRTRTTIDPAIQDLL